MLHDIEKEFNSLVVQQLKLENRNLFDSSKIEL